MNRWPLRLAIFLLLGAVVNVGVSAGCALLAAPGADHDFLDTETSARILRRVGVPGELFERYKGPHGVAWGCPGYRLTFLFLWDDVARPGHSRLYVAAGWPLLCFDADAVWTARTAVARPGVRVARQVSLPAVTLPHRTVPLRPRLWAVGLNSLFYAQLLFLVVRGPFFVRRLVRHTRGLCEACGYDVRHADHQACPECGFAR